MTRTNYVDEEECTPVTRQQCNPVTRQQCSDVVDRVPRQSSRQVIDTGNAIFLSTEMISFLGLQYSLC